MRMTGIESSWESWTILTTKTRTLVGQDLEYDVTLRSGDLILRFQAGRKYNAK